MATAANNYSGFSGYTYSNLYPNWGGIDQAQDTIPEPEEQQAYSVIGDLASPPVDSQKKANIWLILGVLVLLIVFFGKGG